MGRSSKEESLARELAGLSDLSLEELRTRWHDMYGKEPSHRISRTMLMGAVAYRLQEQVHGGLPASTLRYMEKTAMGSKVSSPVRQLQAGTVILREWQGITHHVTVLDDGILYREQRFNSLSAVAKQISGIHRSGPNFFGLKRHVEA